MGVSIIAQLERKNGANFPIALGEDIIGAFVTVASTGARDAIPTAILRTGAICRIAGTNNFYEWNGSAWISYSGFGTSGGVVDFKESVRAATTANITLSGTQTVDGVALVADDRCLVKDQSTGSQNGIYVVKAGAWQRASDADTNAEVTSGLAVVAEQGTANGSKLWILTTANPIVVGTTALAFAAIGTGGVTAGNGLTGTSSLSVLAENATIAVGAGGVKRAAITGDVTIADGSNTSAIADDAVTTAKILDAQVTAGKLASNAVTTAKIADGQITPAKLTSLGALDLSAVDLATTANITLSGEQTIDGTLTSASRVLVWKQTTASQNGIYVTGAGAWTRATDQDATAEFRPGVPFLIKGGTAHAGKLAVLLTGTTITVGSSSIAYGLSFAAPVDVTDDNKVAIASGGGLTYALLVDANVSGSAAIAGTKISPDFGAQDITTTGVINHGSSPALSGDFRVYRGWTMKGRTPSNGGLDINLFRWNTSDQFLIGDSGGVGSVLGGTILFSGDDITLLRTGNVKLKMAANLQVYASTMEWEGSVTTPTFRIAPSSAASTAPNDWNCYGQDMSGAGSSAGAVRWRAGNASGASGTRNGGDFDVQPGAGPTADGELALRAANGAGLGTKRIRINSTGLGFFNTAPVAQPNVTGSRGGNAALASALTALANLGLITDGSSA